MKKKFLLVSDRSKFSTLDVYNGYCQAFLQLKLDYEFFPLYEYLDLFSMDVCLCMLLTKALIKDNGFTHVLFISGIEVPVYVFETLNTYNIKVGIIATDDPHSARPILFDRFPYCKYYFTNEKMCAETGNKRITYLPVAANNVIPQFEEDNIPEEYKTDILFIGSVYPGRIPYLECAAEWAIKTNKKMLVRGHITYVDRVKHPNLYAVCDGGTINNKETLKYLQGARCTINLSRDIYWHPYLPSNASRLMECIPFSANPRMYEASICKCLQIVLDDREEYRDFLGGNAFYFNHKSELIQCLDYVLTGLPEESRKQIVEANFKKVLECGCYQHRLVKLVTFIHETDEQDIRDEMEKAFGKRK